MKRAIKKRRTMVREGSPEWDGGAIVLYRAPDGTVSLDVRVEKETIWLDAHQMAMLFGRDRSVILRHIHNIYDTNELDHASTCANNAQAAADGLVQHRVDGLKRVADNALVAITLMVAESAPDQKDILANVIANLINELK